MPVVKAALENIVLNEVDTTCYESMRNVCDTYNKAIDSIAGLVSCIIRLSMVFYDVKRDIDSKAFVDFIRKRAPR